MSEELLVEEGGSGTRCADEEEVGSGFPDRAAITAVSAFACHGLRHGGEVARRNSDFKPRFARDTTDRLDDSRLLSQSLKVAR